MERDTMIRSSLATALAATVVAGLSSPPPAFAQDESDQRLGTVHFVTSCNETAQRRFDRGMRYQHSFWYRQAKEIFEDVANADPECGMAFWGIALTLLNNPHAAPPASRSEEHTSELQSRPQLVCHLLLEKKKKDSTQKLILCVYESRTCPCIPRATH